MSEVLSGLSVNVSGDHRIDSLFYSSVAFLVSLMILFI